MMKNRLQAFRNRLFRIHDDEPLSRISICVILALDVFILVVIFRGLDDHSRQLTSPWDYMPHDCREMLVREAWTDQERLDRLQALVLADDNPLYHRHESPFEPSKQKRMHPECRVLFEKMALIARDRILLEGFRERRRLTAQKKQITADLDQSKGVYDTSLLEDIAGPEGEGSKLPSIARSMKDKAGRLEALNVRMVGLEAQINAHEKIKDLWAFVAQGGQGRRDRLAGEIRRWDFRYPFKELLWQMVFLLPLVCVFYVWGVHSIRKNNRLQMLISSHLLVIAAIPIFLKILNVVLDLIPRHFLKKFFLLLASLRLIALWHYLVMMGAIAGALVLVYVIQKKVFNRRRLELKRLARGLCRRCGKKLPPEARACPFCGENQWVDCPACGRPTPVAGEFCMACGGPLPRG